MEKMERLVGSACRIFLVMAALVVSNSAVAQHKSWRFVIAPAVSKSWQKAGIGYPEPPVYVDLVVQEPYVSGSLWAVEFENIFENRWRQMNSLGVSSMGYRVNFSYDRNLSTGTLDHTAAQFRYVYYSYKVGRNFTFSPVSLFVRGGVVINCLIAAKLKTQNTSGRWVTIDLVSSNDALNFGFNMDFGLRYDLNNLIALEVGPTYQILLGSTNPNSRKLHLVGAALGLVLK